MNVHYLDKSGYLRYAFVQALSAFEKLPLVGLTTSIGFMAWLTAVLGLWLARCKAKPVLPVFIGLGIFWLTCIASRSMTVCAISCRWRGVCRWFSVWRRCFPVKNQKLPSDLLKNSKKTGIFRTGMV